MTDKPTPVLLADPHKDVLPHRYVVIKRATICLNCRTEHSSCETYAETHLKARWDRKYVTNLRPLYKPEYNLPIELRTMAPQTVPFCHACPNPADVVRNLPYPPPAKPTTIIGFASAEEKKPPKKSPSTTEDLLKGL